MVSDQQSPQTHVITSPEIEALRKIRNFSLLSIIGYAVETVFFVIGIFTFSRLLTLLTNPSASLLQPIGLEISILVLDIVTAIVVLISLFYLRSSFRILKGVSRDFSTPYTGTSLFFIGLGIVFLGTLIILPLILLHLSVFTTIIGLIIIVAVGSIMSLVGEILALIIGAFSLGRHFDKSSYGTAGIMFIVGLFFTLFTLIGAILVYTATISLLKSVPKSL